MPKVTGNDTTLDVLRRLEMVWTEKRMLDRGADMLLRQALEEGASLTAVSRATGMSYDAVRMYRKRKVR